LVVLVTLLAWKLKRKRRREQAATVELPPSALDEKNLEAQHYPSVAPSELYGGNAAVEMGCREPAELVGTPGRPYGRDDPKVVLQP